MAGSRGSGRQGRGLPCAAHPGVPFTQGGISAAFLGAMS